MMIDGSVAPVAAFGPVIRPDAQRQSQPSDTELEEVATLAPVDEAEEGDQADPETERNPLELTPEEERVVRELQQRDRAVRAHEQAHVAAGGQYVTAAPSYDYETGPDGRRYAVGGEVSIDTSRPADPEEAIAKARVVFSAAMAPVDPSPQDYRVASQARMMEAEARRELAAGRQEEMAERRDEAARGGESARLEPGEARDRLAEVFAAVDRPAPEPMFRQVA
ncbi:putative metalloprotease CJM1_0395 family protein [Ectothiorhodospira haloalkaliphila]|uniref:putative metalloprotease CJM1_0395 family protein n=1 Tax=Ectothiorhodospira haloalkaliphila TaxID=421628 RepID=UPI00046CD10E|nr:putative metalloprotease CJM1_0395 family protein [Ectothiorhodospira haloalkaliphila]